jgi:hypothetical protein
MQQDCPNMTEIEQPPTIKSAAVFCVLDAYTGVTMADQL